jgi:SAM-dependent methyltransferase
MTQEQLAVADKHRAYHAEAFGFANASFHQGFIERLDELPLEPGSFDLIISNCVMNLSPDKAAVLAGAYELLRPGGEFFFADVYADRRLPEALGQDPVLVGECLGGALYWGDFLRLAREAGFKDPRLVSDRPIAVVDEVLAGKLGAARFFSATYRLFRLPDLENTAEDYGHTATYQGTIDGCPGSFRLDKENVFPAGQAVPVSGNTFAMLGDTRFGAHFQLAGNTTEHRGAFPTSQGDIPFDSTTPDAAGGSCC